MQNGPFIGLQPLSARYTAMFAALDSPVSMPDCGTDAFSDSDCLIAGVGVGGQLPRPGEGLAAGHAAPAAGAGSAASNTDTVWLPWPTTGTAEAAQLMLLQGEEGAKGCVGGLPHTLARKGGKAGQRAGGAALAAGVLTAPTVLTGAPCTFCISAAPYQRVAALHALHRHRAHLTCNVQGDGQRRSRNDHTHRRRAQAPKPAHTLHAPQPRPLRAAALRPGGALPAHWHPAGRAAGAEQQRRRGVLRHALQLRRAAALA
jgi:hypothetical protein